MIVKLMSGGWIDIASEQGGNKEFHAVSSSADLLPVDPGKHSGEKF